MMLIMVIPGEELQSVWKVDGEFFTVISSPMLQETAVFSSDKEGTITSWWDWYYCDYTEDHQSVMEDFLEGI